MAGRSGQLRGLTVDVHADGLKKLVTVVLMLPSIHVLAREIAGM
jgi:hypothetical protein